MILAVAAQKGGVSKSTTAAAIAQALAYKGKSTLLIDLDAQAGATLIYGAEDSGGSYDLITGRAKAEDLIQEKPAGNIIPANPLLDRLDLELANKPGRDSLLQAQIRPLTGLYDYILLDTAPGLGTCLIQALTASNKVIIPLLCDPQALQGLHQVAETIEEVKTYCNPALKIAAVVITQYQPRATLTRQYEDLITLHCRKMKLKLAKTRIRRAIALQEAQAKRESLYAYNAKCNPAQDYLTLCEELRLIK